MRRLLASTVCRCLVSLTLTSWSAVALAQDGPQQLPTIKLSAGMYVVQVEVARSSLEREIGLMFRKSMPINEVMLFIFDQPSEQCFWMKNTLLPLSVAFLADDGSVVNIDDMKPLTLDSHCSSRPVRFVLEMNEGWFAKRGLKPGSRLQGTPFTH